MIKIEKLKNVKDLNKIKNLKVESYVPITTKIAMANKLSELLISEDTVGTYRYEPVEMMVLKAVAFVGLYTNIELLDDDYDNYDILSRYDLITDLETMVGRDVKSFYEIVDMTLNNKLEEKNSLNRIFASKASDVIGIIDKTMEHVNGMLDKGDPNKIAKYLSKGIEMIAVKLPDLSKVDVSDKIKGKMN